MNSIARPLSLVIVTALSLGSAVAHAQHARSYVIDASAAAIVASARASALARPGSDRSLAEQLIKDGAVVRKDGLRTDIFVPHDVRTCSSNLSIGSPTPNAGERGQPINIRVVMLGTTIQSNDC